MPLKSHGVMVSWGIRSVLERKKIQSSNVNQGEDKQHVKQLEEDKEKRKKELKDIHS